MTRTKLQRTGSTGLPFASSLGREAGGMENRIDRFFRDPLSSLFMPNMTGDFMPQAVLGWLPPVEISETDTEFTVKAELAGMMKKDLSIDYERGMLSIRGEKFEERKENDERRYHLVERSFGSFDRSFTFPESVDSEKISAEFADGILMIHLPKNEEARKPRGRKIEIAEKA